MGRDIIVVVYLDVLLLENLIVNFFLLYITAQTLRIYIKLRYMFLAAFLGSLYVLTLIYPVPKIFSSLIFKLIVACLMTIICFRKKDLNLNLKATAIFIIYSMMLAGLCIFIEFYNSKSLTFDGGFINFSYKYILIAFFISYMVVHRLIIYVKDRKEITKLIYDVEIITGNNAKKVKAFLDTGNELREPATNLPVMLVDKEILEDVKIGGGNKFYIPYKVIDGSKGLLVGFKPTTVNIYNGDTYTSRDMIIAFSDHRLSELNEYNALLSRGII
jgi:stage II sporulation protein GA (sporulation sigma-E factor processing peptidase)